MPRDHAPPDKALLIATKGLTRVFDRRTIVDHVNLRVQRGEIFALIGPTGAGKTTLIKMITTLLKPTAGDASIAGADLRREPAKVRQRIGYVPQAPAADGALTARENLHLTARLHLIPPAEREPCVADALAHARLGDHADQPVHTLPGGMMRGLEIACATLHHPALLIMDEPTSGLDPLARAEVWRYVRALRDRYSMSVLFTTQLMDEAETMAGRIGIMHAGKLQRVGTLGDLRRELGPRATLCDVFTLVAGEALPHRPALAPSEVRSYG